MREEPSQEDYWIAFARNSSGEFTHEQIARAWQKEYPDGSPLNGPGKASGRMRQAKRDAEDRGEIIIIEGKPQKFMINPDYKPSGESCNAESKCGPDNSWRYGQNYILAQLKAMEDSEANPRQWKSLLRELEKHVDIIKSRLEKESNGTSAD